MTTSKLSFKVYLVNEDPWTCTEVRRFGVDADVAMNFVYLREKLQTIFPDLRNKNFNVTWKDDENETITISTNEELEIALNEMKKNFIYKLYVMLQSERDMIDISKLEKAHHPGVICDECDRNILGFRFKCMQCPDYDLCMDCMTLGKHPEHYLVRITQPVEWSSCHGRRLAHHVRKFMKKASHHKETSSKEDERKCSNKKKFDPTFRCRLANGKVYLNDPETIQSLGNFILNLCDVMHENEKQKQKQTKEQHREPSAEAATEAREDPQQEANKPTFMQLLKIFEDNISNISQYLDPLGIDMLSPYEEQKFAESAQKTSTQKPETRVSTSSEDSIKKFPGEGKKLRDDTVNNAAAPLDVQKDSTAAAATATTSAEQAAEADEWTMIQREGPSTSRTSSTSSSNATMPKQAIPSAPVAEPENSSSNERIYPPLPEEVRHELYHPNPKIQRAVEAMMAMGFTNEGSWLTHLLVAQNGDIDKALDVIHPVRRH